MPGQKPGAQPQPDLLTSIRRGQTIETRITTFQHGWLKGAQNAQKAGPEAFTDWVRTQIALIPEYGTAVIVGTMAGQAAGVKAGS